MSQIAIPETLQKRLPLITGILILVLFAGVLYSSGGNIYRLLSKDEQTVPDPLPPTSQVAAPSRINHSQKIVRKHLLGTSASKKTQVVDAPTSKLNLKLRGIYATGDESAAVIIANASGKENVYRVDSDLPGGARLVSIHADHVIIERNQQLEKLVMPKGPSAFSLKKSTAKKTTASPADSGRIKELRRELIKNPSSIGKLVSLSPSLDSGGQLQGYKIYPRGKQPLFDELGLKPGDLVTSVNGTPLNDSRQSLKAIQKLMKARELNITVLRNGETLNIQQALE